MVRRQFRAFVKNVPAHVSVRCIGSVALHGYRQCRAGFRAGAKDVVDKIITAHSTGIDWKRPEYTKNIDNELYGMYVDIAGRFVDKFWMYEAEKQYKLYISAEEQSDEESDGESYFF